MFKKILLGAMIIIIFHLSSTPSLKVINPETWSNQTAYKDANILDVFDVHSHFYDSYFPTKDGIFYANIEFFARKIAHISFYAVLSLLFLININKRNHAFKKAWLGVVLVAFLDECNQYMVAGRTGLFLDVVVDSTSALLALTTVYVAWKVAIKSRRVSKRLAKIKKDAYV